MVLVNCFSFNHNEHSDATEWCNTDMPFRVNWIKFHPTIYGLHNDTQTSHSHCWLADNVLLLLTTIISSIVKGRTDIQSPKCYVDSDQRILLQTQCLSVPCQKVKVLSYTLQQIRVHTCIIENNYQLWKRILQHLPRW